MKNLHKIFILICGISVLATSCSTDTEVNTENADISHLEVQKVLAVDEYSAIADDAITEAFMSSGASGKRFLTNKDSDCYTTVYSDTGFTMLFTDCSLNGSENVNGELSINYSISANSSSFTSTFSDFYVGSKKINGTRIFTMNTTSNDNEIAFTVVSDMTITLEGGEIITEAGTKTTTILFSTDSITVSLSGSWTLVENGDTYIVTITDDLKATVGCEYFSEGTFTLSKNGLEVIVDFGDGTCDNKANIIFPDGKVEEISL